MSSIEEKVKKIVVDHLGIEESKISLDSKFIDDLGADSLDTVELVMAFEEQFDIEIPDDAAETIMTIKDAVDFINSTRTNINNTSKIAQKWLEWGAGPRASTYLILAAKAKALLDGRTTPEIDDINEMINPILRLRIIPNFNAEAEGLNRDTILKELLNDKANIK